jgi:hypothetical protein
MALNLVDEVFDLGDALLVRNGGQEERIALADIKNVNFFPYMSPPQVTLSLRRPSVFGENDRVLCAGAVDAAIDKPDDRKAHRSH